LKDFLLGEKDKGWAQDHIVPMAQHYLKTAFIVFEVV
jgi:hypothetical protein